VSKITLLAIAIFLTALFVSVVVAYFGDTKLGMIFYLTWWLTVGLLETVISTIRHIHKNYNFATRNWAVVILVTPFIVPSITTYLLYVIQM
jgi:hypothetical protein